MTTQKSSQADIVIQAVEKFASLIPLNLQEIFVWYFEQKGVDSPERFLAQTPNQENEAAALGELLQAIADSENIANEQITVGQAQPDNN